MTKRDFLKYIGALTAQTALSSVMAETFFISTAQGASARISDLYKNLNSADGIIVVPTDVKFSELQNSFNRRTLITPSIRVLCLTEAGVSICLQWAKQNQVPLAVRCGGHSYEGFSQTAGLVIDTRMMGDFSFSGSGETVLVGGGAKLGDLNKFLSTKNLAVPVGSCPTVGVSGHVTGGGYGLLARSFGLACDNLINLEIVTADGKTLTANVNEHSDLFWACRGGGGGSFGVITKLEFKTHHIEKASVFRASWVVDADAAIPILQAWQHWAPNASLGITSLLKVTKMKSNSAKQLFSLKCIGQTIESEESATKELQQNIFSVKNPDDYKISTILFTDAVKHFAGSDTTEPATFMKGKSDYISEVMSHEGLEVFFKNIPETVAAIFDSYGGKIRDLGDAETAFPHRSKTLASIQYYSQWSSASATESRLEKIRTFYNSLRPYVSGSAYVNYCDLDLLDWQSAYWGENIKRLIDVKSVYDPENIFRHAQSIPVKNEN